jgi:CheY-like chemotaxis protein
MRRHGLPVGVHSGSMPTIVVLDDDAATRDGLAETLRHLFPEARVATARVDAGADVVERDRASIVLADVAAVERIRRWTPPSARVVALSREMGPDTLSRAEALGVDASVRAPARAAQLRTVLEPMLEACRTR